MTSSTRAASSAESSSTGTVHQWPSGGAGTTNRFTPSSTAARYRPMPASPTTANSAEPFARSGPGDRPRARCRRVPRPSAARGARRGTRAPGRRRIPRAGARAACSGSPTRRSTPASGASSRLRIAYTALASSESMSTTTTSSLQRAPVGRGRRGRRLRTEQPCAAERSSLSIGLTVRMRTPRGRGLL